MVGGLAGFEHTRFQTGTGGTSGQHSNTVGATGATVRGGGMWITSDLFMSNSKEHGHEAH